MEYHSMNFHLLAALPSCTFSSAGKLVAGLPGLLLAFEDEPENKAL